MTVLELSGLGEPFRTRLLPALSRGMGELIVPVPVLIETMALVRLTGSRYAPNQEAAAIRRDDAALWQAIRARRDGAGDEGAGTDLKEPEWRVFAEPDPDLCNAGFQLRPVAPPARWQPWIDRVVLVERLREVSCASS